jgi:hypothetical protein
MDVSRRDLCSALIGAAGLLGLGSSGFARAATAGALRDATLTPLQRFMKVYASLEAGTLWYWYSGIVEMAVQDGPIVPLIGIDTLIRRDVSLNADGTFTVMSTEANYFRGLDDARPVDEIANPVTGRTVQPLHFSEARRRNVWSEQALLPRKTGVIETSVAWREAGAYSWLNRTLHADAPHPLDIREWPLEASGMRNRTGSFSTHCALTRDIADPALPSAPCSFNYEAIFGWFPWLLMGQRPGQLLWRAQGMKIPALDQMPEASRAGFEQTFPAILTGADFGPDGANLWERFRATRRPSKP